MEWSLRPLRFSLIGAGASFECARHWGSLPVALLIADTVAFPVNRWLIARGKEYAVGHRHHQR